MNSNNAKKLKQMKTKLIQKKIDEANFSSEKIKECVNVFNSLDSNENNLDKNDEKILKALLKSIAKLNIKRINLIKSLYTDILDNFIKKINKLTTNVEKINYTIVTINNAKEEISEAIIRNLQEKDDLSTLFNKKTNIYKSIILYNIAFDYAINYFEAK